MLLTLLAYLGGLLTIASPCILPVLPFVLARADRPFRRGGLPLLAGLALAFAVAATLAAVGGGWAVRADEYGRDAAMALLALFGLSLLSDAVAERLSRPFVALGARLSRSAGGGGAGSSLLLGVASGLLWAPCAGPILGLILTGAALSGPAPVTTFLLLAYAAGAATSLAGALLLGGRVFALMKRSAAAGERLRRALGAAVLLSVAAVAAGVDTRALARISRAESAGLERWIVDRLRPAPGAFSAAEDALFEGGELPPFSGAVAWLNSPPLHRAALRGKVVLVDFWTYSCANCLRTLPYVQAWARKYGGHGFVVVGVHSPEFAFEKNVANVRRAARELGIEYPVAVDSELAIWRAYGNEYWPADYLVDAEGRVRDRHFGEGGYEATEREIQGLLAEAGRRGVPGGLVSPRGSGAERAPDLAALQSPETYVGYARQTRFASGVPRKDAPRDYAPPRALLRNQWALAGLWIVGAEKASLTRAPGGMVFRFHARDLNLVLGPAADGKPVRFRVSIDGAPPGADGGADVDARGDGEIRERRLYQLIRQRGEVRYRTFRIEFLEPCVEAYAFTFG